MATKRTHRGNDLAGSLRVLRAERGWSREAAAERAGIAVETMARFERGERKPSLPVVLRLAGAFGVTVEELATGRRPETDQADPPLVVASLRTLRRLDARQLSLAHQLLALVERFEA